MKLYIVVEAQYLVGCAQTEAESLGAYAQAFTTRQAAYEALRQLADDRIYEAFEGLEQPERDERTDEAMRDTFGEYKVHDVTDEEADFGWSWENCDHAYVWRIIGQDA